MPARAKKNNDRLERMHGFSIDEATRTVYLMDDICDLQACETIKNLLYLDGLSKDEITLIICSPGGEVNAGMAIYDAIKSLNSPVKAVILGHADSMCSIIPQACAKRLMSKHAVMVVHEGSSGMAGHVRDVEAHGEWLKKDRERMYEIYMQGIERAGKKMERKKLETLCRNDAYLTAQDAVELGFADGILDTPLVG